MRRFLFALTAPLIAGCAHLSDATQRPANDADLLHTAVKQMTDVIVYDIFSPPQASRAYAYASVAAFEALRHSQPGFRSFAGQLKGLTAVPEPTTGSVDLTLASLHAFMTVGRQLTFSRQRMDSLRSAMHRRAGEGLDRAVFDSSIAYGDRVAQHILAWAAKDNFLQSRGLPKYSVSTAAGRWIPTPPAYMDAVEPNWATLRPFVLDSASQLRPKPPLKYDMTVGSPFYKQVKEVYDVGRSLTTEQRSIAAFWDCNPYVMNVQGHAMYATKKITPGGHWMGIVATASRKAGATLSQAAEAYALTALALADGFISAWEEKYRSSVVRPETVINASIDESWQPLLQTPPFPEYTSGHSVISTAAAEVLTHVFGANFAFTDSTELEYGLPIRSFSSFEQAAAEAAMSRLYGGIHYRMAIEEGVVQGRKLGQYVVSTIKTRAPDAIAQRPAP